MPSGKKKTHEQYVAELSYVNANLKVLGQYVNHKTKISHQCLVDGYIWDIAPHNTLKGHGCPMCYGNIKRTDDEYHQMVSNIHPNIEVVDLYLGSNTKIKHRCKIDGYEWESKPVTILGGFGCACCAGKVIGPAPEYKNSIWASTYREYFSQYLSDDQMKRYTPKSHQKLEIVCPCCSRCKQVDIATLANYGLRCQCSDGVSYPNKFIYSVLNQLNVDYQTEYSATWTNGRFYDIYCDSLKLVIENHGIQHYEECDFTERTLQEEQDNDKYKQNLALQNGVKYYVVLDCRYSNETWIKNSLMNSILPHLLQFDEKDVDWKQTSLFAIKNLAAQAASLYESGLSTKDIGIRLHMSISTVNGWLNRMAQIGLCNYNGKNEQKKACSKKIICVELNRIFQSLASAAEFAGVSISSISRCLRGLSHTSGGYHWEYV